MHLAQPITLNSGAVIPNRICKSALSEQLSDLSHNPTRELVKLYGTWASSGAGLLITGNVMLSRRMIGEPRNVVLDENSDLRLFRAWAEAAQRHGARCYMQLNHPGRQVPSMMDISPRAPSAVAMKGGMRLGFNTPVALTDEEIRDIIRRFGVTARRARESGFAGVQIHGAHGYLINQFLSPLQNLRNDQWGGSLENRMRFVLEVYRSIRRAVGADFPVAIKLNSTDAQAGGYAEEDALRVAQALDAEGIDFIEVSGGNYESQAMMGSEEQVQRGEGYFVDFARRLKTAVKAPVMVTGGLRRPAFMEALVRDGQCDLVGMGRPFALMPDLGEQILKRQLVRPVETPYIRTGIGMVDRMLVINITWYEKQLDRMARGKAPALNLSPWRSVLHTVATMGLKGILPRRA